MATLSNEERARLRRAAAAAPLPRMAEERREPVEQFLVHIKGCTPEGKPVPSPVGPFPTREVATRWWELNGTRLIDPFEIAEVTITPMYLSWRP
jgi:hypothetical protein